MASPRELKRAWRAAVLRRDVERVGGIDVTAPHACPEAGPPPVAARCIVPLRAALATGTASVHAAVGDVLVVPLPCVGADGCGAVTISGQGHVTSAGIAGDVRVAVTVVPEDGFVLLGGGDVEHRQDITLRDALLGFELRYEHPRGHVYEVRARTRVVRPGHRHRIVGAGLVRPDGSDGDLVLVFSVVFPDEVDEERRGALERALA